ncbi:hypothetical protein cypCar_00046644 [Cyprinus carpio]|nr:hypothetical protein cypCar_00046644 [Cyprinus carpio]
MFPSLMDFWKGSYITWSWFHVQLLEQATLNFWDWEKGERLDYFYNGNPRYTRITAMEYLNGHDCSLLLTGTDDGALRIWKNFADQRNPEMVTAWQGLSDMLPTTRGLLSDSYTLCANTALLLSYEFLFPCLLCLASVWKKLSEFPIFLHDAGL